MSPLRRIPRDARDVTAGGVRVRAVASGARERPPLLLLHGFLSDHSSFDDVVDRLSERYYVVTPDLPGFGESEKPSPTHFPYGVERFSECVADLIAAFELGRVHLLGHSMGGAVALTLAAQHPELVQRLVLVDPLIYPLVLRGPARMPLWPIVGPFLFKQLYGRAMFRAHFRDGVYEPGHLMNLPRVDALYDKFNVPAARESAYATLKTLEDTRVTTARLGRVRAPVLVVWGRNDALTDAQNAQRLVKDLFDARLCLLDCGHSPHEERPTELGNAVVKFLEGQR